MGSVFCGRDFGEHGGESTQCICSNPSARVDTGEGSSGIVENGDEKFLVGGLFVDVSYTKYGRSGSYSSFRDGRLVSPGTITSNGEEGPKGDSGNLESSSYSFDGRDNAKVGGGGNAIELTDPMP